MKKIYGENCEFKNQEEAEKRLEELLEKHDETRKEIIELNKKYRELSNKLLELGDIDADIVREANRIFREYSLSSIYQNDDWKERKKAIGK